MPDERIPEDEPAEVRFRRALDELEKEQLDQTEEMLAEVESAADRLRGGDPKIDGDFETRLKEIELRAAAARATQQSSKAQEQKRIADSSESYRGLGVGLTLAYTIIGVPLIGAAIGWFIDNSAGTSNWLGICTMIGAAVGVALALMIMARANEKS